MGNPEYITLGVYKSFHKIFIGQGHLRGREQSLVFFWKFILAILMKSKQFFGSCHHSLYCKQYYTASQFQNIYIAYFIKIFTLNLLSDVIHISVNVLKKGRFKTNIWYSSLHYPRSLAACSCSVIITSVLINYENIRLRGLSKISLTH